MVPADGGRTTPATNAFTVAAFVYKLFAPLTETVEVKYEMVVEATDAIPAGDAPERIDAIP